MLEDFKNRGGRIVERDSRFHFHVPTFENGAWAEQVTSLKPVQKPFPFIFGLNL